MLCGLNKVEQGGFGPLQPVRRLREHGTAAIKDDDKMTAVSAVDSGIIGDPSLRPRRP